MTISVVQTAGAAGAGSGSISLNFGSNVTVGNSVVIWIGDYNTSNTVISSSAPTYNGASVTGATKLVEVQNTKPAGSNNIMYFAVWLLPNVQSAGTSVAFTVTGANSDTNSHYYIAEVSGLGTSPSIDSASPNPKSSSGIGGGAITSGATGNAVGSSGIVLGGMMQDGASSGWTGPAGWTTIATTSYTGASYEIFSAAGSNYTWNCPSGTGAGEWAAGAVILKATAGGGGTSVALPVSQVTVAGPAPGLKVALPLTIGQVTVGAPALAPKVSVPLNVAQLTVAAPAPGLLVKLPLTVGAVLVSAPAPSLAVSLPLTVAAVVIAAPPVTPAHGQPPVTVSLPVAAVAISARPPGLAVYVALPVAGVRVLAIPPLPNGQNRETSRLLVRTGIAKFFGGSTYDATFQAYRGGPLLAYGLSTVRPYQAKRVPDTDYVMGLNPGRGMGAMMVLEMAETRDTMLTIPGLPAGVKGGQRHLVYPVQCHVFHLAHQPYAEVAEQDVDTLVQAIQEYIYTDPTLGGTCYQAGMNSAGIHVVIDPSEDWKEITATHFRVMFDAEVQIVI